MKFDKETVIAIAICAVILFGWDPFCRYMGWIQTPPVPVAAPVATPTPAAVPPAAAAKAPIQTVTTAAVPAVEPVAAVLMHNARRFQSGQGLAEMVDGDIPRILHLLLGLVRPEI